MSTFPPCPCGKPWVDLRKFSHEIRDHVENEVMMLGEYVKVTIPGGQMGANDRTWLVPRRCIAFHGITGQQLLSGTSGFMEITANDRNK